MWYLKDFVEMSGSVIRLDTQMKVFKIGVMLTLLHACKTWTDVLHFDHHPQAFDILRKHVMNIASKEALGRYILLLHLLVLMAVYKHDIFTQVGTR